MTFFFNANCFLSLLDALHVNQVSGLLCLAIMLSDSLAIM